jgi:hypothetical protein
MAYFCILWPAEPYLFKTAARGDIFHPNMPPRWIWVWDPWYRQFSKSDHLFLHIRDNTCLSLCKTSNAHMVNHWREQHVSNGGQGFKAESEALPCSSRKRERERKAPSYHDVYDSERHYQPLMIKDLTREERICRLRKYNILQNSFLFLIFC